MKSRIFFILLFAFAIISVTGCKTSNKTEEYPYEMHSSAMSLMQACKDLVKNNGVETCNHDGPYHIVYSAMSLTGFANSGSADSAKIGVVSFTEQYRQDNAIFHTVWEKGDSITFGCAKHRIIFPFPDTARAEVHNFELTLIPVADYQAAPTNFPTTGHIQGVIKSQDITAIENIRLESPTGYIKTNEPALYDNLYSSKGFVCDVCIRGKAGKTPCYIINNHDGVKAALKWKAKRECQ